MFLNPKKPIATCVAKTCDNCDVQNRIHCHFKLKDLVHFLLISLPPFLLGGVGLYQVAGYLLVPWLLFVVAFFGFIEIRVMCSHCPHYAEKETSLKCWANYGAPKLWQYRPGPMSMGEKIVFFLGFLVVWGYPFLFLMVSKQWFLLLVYTATTGGFFMTLKIFLCTQCMNMACPLNTVDVETRDQFFKKNPLISKAWQDHMSD